MPSWQAVYREHPTKVLTTATSDFGCMACRCWCLKITAQQTLSGRSSVKICYMFQTQDTIESSLHPPFLCFGHHTQQEVIFKSDYLRYNRLH
jgi:hypothetical protein